VKILKLKVYEITAHLLQNNGENLEQDQKTVPAMPTNKLTKHANNLESSHENRNTRKGKGVGKVFIMIV
jgi:hypothetical protein